MKSVITLSVVLLALLVVLLGCEKKEEKPVPKAPEQSQAFNPNVPSQTPPAGMQPPPGMQQPQGMQPPPGMQQPQGMQPPAGMQSPPGMQSPHGDAMPKTTKTVMVPDAVKGSWSKVTLVFEDKSGKKKTEYTVKVGSSLEIPGTGLKVQVGEFLPDFQMTDTTITSKSNEPNNPAVRVEVFEKGKAIYKNWLYAKFPEIHKFEHERYSLMLKGGVKS